MPWASAATSGFLATATEWPVVHRVPPPPHLAGFALKTPPSGGVVSSLTVLQCISHLGSGGVSRSGFLRRRPDRHTGPPCPPDRRNRCRIPSHGRSSSGTTIRAVSGFQDAVLRYRLSIAALGPSTGYNNSDRAVVSAVAKLVRRHHGDAFSITPATLMRWRRQRPDDSRNHRTTTNRVASDRRGDRCENPASISVA